MVFGTPILFECKNWDKHVTSNEIRNFILKGTPAKTRFLIAWNSISGEDELKSSKLEIIKAKERGIYILVLTKIDFEKIAGGIDPELIVSEKYYELIKDKVSVTSQLWKDFTESDFSMSKKKNITTVHITAKGIEVFNKHFKKIMLRTQDKPKTDERRRLIVFKID